MSNSDKLAQRLADACNALFAQTARPDLSNIAGSDFYTKANAAGVAQWFIDVHDPRFGAKGDAISVGDGVVTGGSTYATAQYNFTAANIGQSLWLGTDPTLRTITGVSGSAAVFSPTFGNGTQVQGLWGTDDTVAIQAAMDYCQTHFAGLTGASSTNIFAYVRGGIPMGGTVLLRSGRGYIVGNSPASYAGGKLSALQLHKRCGFVGGGREGSFGTALHFKPGSQGHVLANEVPDANTDFADFMTVGGFSIYCYGDGWNAGSGSLDGLQISVQANGYAKVDTFNRVAHLQVYDAGRDGFSFSGRGELLGLDLIASYCVRNGIRVNNLADSRFFHCVAGGNSKAGIYVYGGGPVHFIGCKSFYNGAAGGTDDTQSCNWYLGSDNAYTGISTFMSCEGQESRGSSWVIASGRHSLTNCWALDPGRQPLGDGGSAPESTVPANVAGFKLQSVFANNVTFANCAVRATLTNFSGTPGTLFNTKWALWIDPWDGSLGGPQGNVGDIYYTTTVTPPTGSPINGVSFATGGGAIGGGVSNGRNTGLRVNGVACT